jgi:putative ABC transport system permease protein
MNTSWRKVVRDLAQARLRTLLAIASIAAGVLALGLVFGLSDIMRTRMMQDHQASMPAHISVGGGPFGLDSVRAVQSERNVEAVMAEIETQFRWRVPDETEWRMGTLVARDDYAMPGMRRLALTQGVWPTRGALNVEHQSAIFFGVEPGESILIEDGRRVRSVAVGGIIRSSSVNPPQFGGNATFYADPDTALSLIGIADANRLYVRLTAFEQQAAEENARRIQNRLERMGVRVTGYMLHDPDVHPLQTMVDTIAVILGILGALALGLSAFLIINTSRAMIVQQVWQIGVMKVYGATVERVLGIYLLSAFLVGLLAALIAIPAAILATFYLSDWLLNMINIQRGAFRIVPQAVIIQAVVALVVPVLAALGPIIGGARITPREAISTYGLGDGFGSGWLDRLTTHLRFLPRPLTLSLRNSLRHKTRVVLTLLTLSIAGIMFVGVLAVGDSLDRTLELLIRDLGLDVWVVFGQPERAERLTEIAETVPGVLHAEVWDQRPAYLALATGEDKEIYLMGVPDASAMFHPRIVQGRNLLPDDGHAILLNNKIATDHGIDVGDRIELTIGGRTSAWTVVGLVTSITNEQLDCFVPLHTLSREAGSLNRGTVVMIQSTDQSDALLQAVRSAYVGRNLEPAFLLSANQIRTQTRAQFGIVLALMLSMALLIAIVGGLGLMGTLSINVLERRREIGIMRSVGATSMAIVGTFIAEGLALGLFSWLIAAPLSYPGATFFSQVVGVALFRVPLDFQYSHTALVLWLALVIVLSTLASLWPAIRAANTRIIDALRFE